MSILRSALAPAAVAAGIGLLPPAAAADDATSTVMSSMHKALRAEDIKLWAAPPQLPKGTEQAVLAGDPAKPGVFIIRARMPDGASIGPHWHSQAEYITVLQGTFHIGFGAKFDKSKTTSLTAGGFMSMPAKMQHFVWIEGDTVIQVVGNGPFDINFVNPDDDPSKPAMR